MILVFEGIDGCGKSSLSRLFAERHKIAWTCEPHERLEQAQWSALTPAEQIRFFAHDRLTYWIVEAVTGTTPRACFTSPTIDLVQDRSAVSSLVYQEDSEHSVQHILRCQSIPLPNLVVYVRVPVEVAVDRLRARGDAKGDTYDGVTIDRLKELHARYERLCGGDEPELSKWGPVVIVVDGTEDLDTVVQRLSEHLVEQGFLF